MLDSSIDLERLGWNDEVRARVTNPLKPETLRSVFIIIPGNSGDVALATSVVRFIKDRNPQCVVSFAVKRSNIPLLKLCPGVDEAIELPAPGANPSRQNYLARFAGRADAVIYPICLFEDIFLLRRFNFLETIWLLSGVEGGMPETPHKLWLSPPHDPGIAVQVLNRCLSDSFESSLKVRANRQPREIVGQLFRQRKVRNIGWKSRGKLLRHVAYLRQLASKTVIEDAKRQFVIVSSEANAMSPPPKMLFERVIRLLQSRGRIVLQNVLDPLHAAPGTVPLVCSYEEFLCLREADIPFVGWRSGLCDIAAASQAPMCVLYPSSMDGCSVGLQANCEVPIKSFGFNAMNIDANCAEVVDDGAEDIDLKLIAGMLD